MRESDEDAEEMGWGKPRSGSGEREEERRHGIRVETVD